MPPVALQFSRPSGPANLPSGAIGARVLHGRLTCRADHAQSSAKYRGNSRDRTVQRLHILSTGSTPMNKTKLSHPRGAQGG